MQTNHNSYARLHNSVGNIADENCSFPNIDHTEETKPI